MGASQKSRQTHFPSNGSRIPTQSQTIAPCLLRRIPYAFNYHLNQQGSFRGLAFANFRQAADPDTVVATLNGFNIQGRPYSTVILNNTKNRNINVCERTGMW